MPDQRNLITVWVIEDHKTYGQRLLRALNRQEGISCPCTFSACEDALVALKTYDHPHVVLLDVELPGMSGIEALAHFRRLVPSTALVILTVFEDEEKIFGAICAGASGYLLKNASVGDIADGVRSAAVGGSPITPTIARRVLDMFSKANLPQRDYGLSPREQAILQLLVQGKTIKAVAGDLGLGFYTVDEYIRSIYEKLQVRSRGSAVAKAVRERLVPPQTS